MKIYHGRWDDSPKELVGEVSNVEEMYSVIQSYVPERFKNGYRQWTDELKETGRLVCDYGSWSDFLFITDFNCKSLKEFFEVG